MVMIYKEVMAALFDFNATTYYSWKKQERPIIRLIEKYFTKEDLEEFLNSEKISKLEYCQKTMNKHNHIFRVFKTILLKIFQLHDSAYKRNLDFQDVIRGDSLKDPMEYIENHENEALYQNINTIDYLCYALAKNKLSIHPRENLFDVLIKYYDEYKNNVDNRMNSLCLESICNILTNECKSCSDLIDILCIDNSLYVLKHYVDYYNFIDDQFLNVDDIYISNLSLEFSIRYNLHLKKSNKNFEEMYDKYKVPEFGKSKIDYDKFKKDIDNL